MEVCVKIGGFSKQSLSSVCYWRIGGFIAIRGIKVEFRSALPALLDACIFQCLKVVDAIDGDGPPQHYQYVLVW